MEGWGGGLPKVRSDSSKMVNGGETKRMYATSGHLVVFLLELCFVLLTSPHVSVWTPRLNFVSLALRSENGDCWRT